MDPHQWTIVLWAVTGLVMAYSWLPALIAMLGGTQTRVVVDTADPHVPEAEWEHGYWSKQLTDLGFVSLGTIRMGTRFDGPSIGQVSVMHVYFHSGHRVFTWIGRQPAPLSVWRMVVFATVLNDGGLLTTNNVTDLKAEEGHEFIIQGRQSFQLDDVLAAHLARMEQLERGGRRADSLGTIESLAEAVTRFFPPLNRMEGARRGRHFLSTRLPIHIVMGIPGVYMVGWAHWGNPITQLTMAILLLAGERTSRRQSGAMMRIEIAAAIHFANLPRREIDA